MLLNVILLRACTPMHLVRVYPPAYFGRQRGGNLLLQRDEQSAMPCSLQQLEQSPTMVSVEPMETNASAVLSHAEWLGRARAVQQESRRLREYARALRVRCQQSYRRYLLIACAWCHKPIRWQSIQGTRPVPRTSHGICPTCYVTVTRLLLREARGKGIYQ